MNDYNSLNAEARKLSQSPNDNEVSVLLAKTTTLPADQRLAIYSTLLKSESLTSPQRDAIEKDLGSAIGASGSITHRFIPKVLYSIRDESLLLDIIRRTGYLHSALIETVKGLLEDRNDLSIDFLSKLSKHIEDRFSPSQLGGFPSDRDRNEADALLLSISRRVDRPMYRPLHPIAVAAKKATC